MKSKAAPIRIRIEGAGRTLSYEGMGPRNALAWLDREWFGPRAAEPDDVVTVYSFGKPQ